MDPIVVTLVAGVTADTTALKRRLTILANGFEDVAEALRRTVRQLDTLDTHDRDRYDDETVAQAEADLARFREARHRAEQEAGGR